MWIFSCAFCIIETCVGFPQPPEPNLCVTGLMCTCLSSQGPPSVLRGLCAPVLAPLACPLLHGACVPLSWLHGLPSALKGLCALLSASGVLVLHCRASVDLFWLPLPILCIVGFVCSCFISLPALFVAGLILLLVF